MINYEIKKTQSKELSYADILSQGGNIVIPLIQRDYAQGRNTDKAREVRKSFVSDLYNNLMSADKVMNLDFIYGAKDDERFVPLDGQQRLTTLFLLHLYLDALRGPQDATIEFKFSYETRESSRRFCAHLIKSRFKLFNEDAFMESTDSKGNKSIPTLSSIIKDQSWWLNAWMADPTVAGMLCMLDEIHHVFFKDWRKAADRLFVTENQPIRFQYLPLINFYDPDDLYIKMNARGLPLTDFEIFKSRWMEEIEKVYSKDEAKSIKTWIDVDWTDFLWPMRSTGLKNIDPYFQNLLKLVIGNAMASFGNKDTDIQMLFEANGNKQTFSFAKYVEDYNVSFSKTLLDRINEELTQLCTDKSLFTRLRNNTISSDGWMNIANLWNSFIINEWDPSKPDYKGRVSLYAVSRFSSLLPSANDEEVKEWLRLMHNLVENKRFNDCDDAVNFIRDIDSVLAKIKLYADKRSPAHRINDWVAQSSFIPNSGFTDVQWQEEVIKAELRKNPVWDKELTECERHFYLNGSAALPLWCAGEIDLKLPFSTQNIHGDLDSFKSYKDKLIALFNEAGKKDSDVTKEYLLVRALLSKGNYMPALTSDRRNIYNDPGHRDYSWRALLRFGKDTNEKAVQLIKEVIDDKDYKHNNVSNSLKDIIRNRTRRNMPLWRRLLTSRFGNEILSCSNQGFLSFVDGKQENVLIYGSSRRSGYHVELNTLYIEKLLKSYYPDVKVSVSWNIGTETDYTIMVNGISISYWDGVWYNDKLCISEFQDLVKFIKDHI